MTPEIGFNDASLYNRLDKFNYSAYYTQYIDYLCITQSDYVWIDFFLLTLSQIQGGSFVHISFQYSHTSSFYTRCIVFSFSFDLKYCLVAIDLPKAKHYRRRQSIGPYSGTR